MADVFDLYVKDNRTIQFKFTEPIMLEDSHVTDWVFHIPRILNNLDVSGWAWWLVYINARGRKYSELLELSEDPESPLEKCIATYSVDYGMSIKAGIVRFSLEAINTDAGGEILNEWHTQTYQAKVQDTLQGNQVEFAETESDIISALIIEVQNKVRQLVGGATPEPVSLIADMSDTKKVYLYVGEESGESTNYWYYYNGSAWMAGGLYASGITVDSVPTQGSSNTVSSGGVYTALEEINTELSAMSTATDEDVGKALKAKTVTNGKVTEWEFDDVGQDETIAHALAIAVLNGVALTDPNAVDALNRLKEYWGSGVMANVTFNNEHCEISNKSTITPIGQKYNAVVTASVGYILGVVTYTMGGVTYTAVDGVISIDKVTGDITITATASEPQPVSGLLYRWVGSDADFTADDMWWYDREADLGLHFYGSSTSNGQCVSMADVASTYGNRLTDTGILATNDYTLEVVFDNKATTGGLVVSLNASASNGGVGIGLLNGNMYGVKPYAPYVVATQGLQVVTMRSDVTKDIIRNGTVLTSLEKGEGNKYNLSATATHILAGSRDKGNNSRFIGDIYEIRVYEGTLTDEQIMQNHAIDIAKYRIEV